VVIPKIEKGDTLVMKKKHPCGSFEFEVLRTGSDIRIRCRGCGHDLTVPRIKLEKNIKRIEQNQATDKDNGGNKNEQQP